jgi:hypothetical protein
MHAFLLRLGIFESDACVISLWHGTGQRGGTGVLGEQFGGIGVTDDYAAYQSLFEGHQLCWMGAVVEVFVG